jgi:hypothetical protein
LLLNNEMLTENRHIVEVVINVKSN